MKYPTTKNNKNKIKKELNDKNTNTDRQYSNPKPPAEGVHQTRKGGKTKYPTPTNHGRKTQLI